MKYLMLLVFFLSCAHKEVSVGLNKELDGYDYPFKIHEFEFKSQRQELFMSYMDVNPKAKKAIVLLHGKNFNGAYFEKTAEFLKAKGFRVIIIDQLGFGKSSKPLDYQYSFHGLAYNTHELIKSLKINSYLLLGHSMGGMLATRYALMYPKEVKKLILLNPIGLEDWKLMAPYQSVDQGFKGELNKTDKNIKDYQVISYYDNKWKDEYQKWLTPLIGWNNGPDRKHMAMISALTSDMVFTQPVIYEFSKLKVPTVLMIGDRDRTAIGKNLASKEVAKTMGHYDLLAPKIQKMIPNSKLYLFKNIGHLPHIESFKDFTNKLAKEI